MEVEVKVEVSHKPSDHGLI